MLKKQYNSHFLSGVFKKIEGKLNWDDIHNEDLRVRPVDTTFLYEFIYYMYNRRVYKNLDFKLVKIIEKDVEDLVKAYKDREFYFAKVIFEELQFLFDEDYPAEKAKFLDYLRKRNKKTQLKRADNLQSNLEQSKVKKYKERYSVLDNAMRKKLPKR